MLKINNIEVVYSSVILVLKRISLEVATSQIVCLLGANGAGKTTTLKAISGLLEAEDGKITSGNVQFEERDISRLSPEDIVKLGISQVMEGRRIFDQLTAEENLRAGGISYSKGDQIKKDLAIVYSYFPRLKDLRNSTSGYLSGGEQQMLVIGRALMAHPKLMLLDEPSLGLAPLLVKEIYDIVQKINKEEKTSILLVEQNAKAALSVSDYGYVMENGKIVFDGPAEILKNNEDVKEFYLGIGSSGEQKNYKEIKHYRRRKRWL